MNAGRILLVDDEPNVRLVFRTALEASGFAVSEASDGLGAIESVRRDPPDAVLLDLRMQGLDGLATLERIGALGLGVPTVVVTAHGGIPDAVTAIRLGAVDFVAKPISPAALRSVLAGVIARHPRPARPAPSPAAGALVAARTALDFLELESAEAELRRALKLDPRSAEAHNLLGVLQERKGRRRDAADSYRAALRAEQGYAPAKMNLFRLYEKTRFGRSDRAIDLGEGRSQAGEALR